MNELHPPPARRSAWTLRQKIIRVLWGTLARLTWLVLPASRSALIRLFGGSVGRGCRFASSCQITIPWNVRIGSGVEVAPRALLYSLGLITLQDDVVIDYAAHLCAGTHDMRDSTFPLLRPPINVGKGSFIGIDAFIGPGVTLGAGVRVWPRASVYRNFRDGVEVRGNPAREVPAEGPEA